MLHLFKIFFQISSLIIALSLHAAESIPVELKDVGIEEHLGQSIPLDSTFTNEKGETVPLKNYFDGKRPVILTLVYYTCPNICHYLLDGFAHSLQKLSFSFLNQF